MYLILCGVPSALATLLKLIPSKQVCNHNSLDAHLAHPVGQRIENT
jgi:hypothetical protein